MSLGIDPTLQYANGNWEPLKPADLERPGPYNTRLTKGLPPTPIANPGLASLKAAAKPAKQPTTCTSWRSRATSKRRHFFTDDYERSSSATTRRSTPGRARGGTGRASVGLIADPVSHSLSPRMQKPPSAARPRLGVRAAARRRRATGRRCAGLVGAVVRGANVTIPHKERRGRPVDDLTTAARAAGSVNTIVVHDGGR